jgi:hypothetical protein
MNCPPPGKGAGESRLERDTSSACAPAPQVCAACGRSAADLDLRPFLTRLALICAECRLCAILDRTSRRGRP